MLLLSKKPIMKVISVKGQSFIIRIPQKEGNVFGVYSYVPTKRHRKNISFIFLELIWLNKRDQMASGYFVNRINFLRFIILFTPMYIYKSHFLEHIRQGILLYIRRLNKTKILITFQKSSRQVYLHISPCWSGVEYNPQP